MESLKHHKIEEKLQIAKRVASCLILALKNYNLYPEGHDNRKRSMEQFRNPLSAYLNLFGELRLDVEKNRICFDGNEVHSEAGSEGNLPAILYRDGVKWIEFQKGIESKEIFNFLKLINQYWILSAEPEGDLVTGFWEAEFSHIKYQVSDFYWGIQPSDDFQVKSEVNESNAEPEDKDALKFDGTRESTSIAQVKLTPEEEAQLQEMVKLEESRDIKADFLNILLDNILDQEDQDNWKIAAEAIKEEFIESIANRDFEFALTIFRHLNQVRKGRTLNNTSLIQFLDEFFIMISSEQTLIPLNNHFRLTQTEIVQIKQIFSFLPPSAVDPLAKLMLKTKSIPIKQLCNDAIIDLSTKDIRPLSEMLASPDETLVQRLVYMLGAIRDEKADQLLMNITQHSSPLVRIEAIKAFLRRSPVNIVKVFSFIDDPNDSIRHLILTYLGREKNEEAEKALSAYLEKNITGKSEKKYIRECYQALGSCGSNRSIPFLQNILMHPGWLPTRNRTLNRHGAAAALAAIGTHEALSVLETAGKSLNLGIRQAARQAIRGLKEIK